MVGTQQDSKIPRTLWFRRVSRFVFFSPSLSRSVHNYVYALCIRATHLKVRAAPVWHARSINASAIIVPKRHTPCIQQPRMHDNDGSQPACEWGAKHTCTRALDMRADIYAGHIIESS